MESSDDDADFKLAMALSLQHSPQATKFADRRGIDLTSDSDDEGEEIARAIALSLQDTASLGHTVTTNVQPPSRAAYSISETKNAAPQLGPTRSLDLAGLDRKAMELERLARFGKRKRDPSPERPSKQIAKTPAIDVVPTSSIMSSPSAGNAVSFPTGAIKRTSATKFPRTDDITVDELLEADRVNTAVISSFMWDAEWLNKKLNPHKVKQIWIMNAKDGKTQERWRQEMQDCGIPNLTIHFPPMSGQIHSMHSKFMLLFGREKLRFVVPTANMTPIDWGEVKNAWQPGVMENSVFLVDLPRRTDGAAARKDSLTGFGRELVYFLEQQEVDRKVIDGVLKFDFSQTSHLAFVHSIGGTHQGKLEHPTGLSGLTQAVRNLQLGDVEDLQLDYAASSLGAINDNLLQRIYLAACGEPLTSSTASSNVRNHVRIYFPTDETVQKSIGGPDCGGIISLTRQYYNAAGFPRDCLHNYDSTRRGMLSHNKLLFARGTKKNGTPFAWVYIGSANISESAWGGQRVLKSGQMGSLSIRNWECGVVVPVPHAKMANAKVCKGEVPPMSVFEGTIEVPFVHPGQAYGREQPWFFKRG